MWHIVFRKEVKRMNEIINMTNKEAADILRKMVHDAEIVYLRGNSNTRRLLNVLRINMAINKGISLLETTNDEEINTTDKRPGCYCEFDSCEESDCKWKNTCIRN